ncbi:hypothetical protein REG_1483 [Candidatus Regiella insecticola LSR1]|uniref:Uncharacterized protein n=1 Tax=Candidatus Regiella insecticola LSR1 TaxID=663321 RepID=E0WTV4_9ENTR|nr:hypothetical protein REG_1483 [Candidatus Regiella insecticola LSR1]
MSVDRLRDSASTRSQQRGSFKDEGYIPTVLKEGSLKIWQIKINLNLIKKNLIQKKILQHQDVASFYSNKRTPFTSRQYVNGGSHY